jgi:hypothetical protein
MPKTDGDRRREQHQLRRVRRTTHLDAADEKARVELIGGYALYFSITDNLVTVHAVWHGARGSGPPLP